MDELDLQTLWQEQAIDDEAFAPGRGRAALDLAVPTSQFVSQLSQFGRRPEPRRAVALFALAATTLLVVAGAAALRISTPPAPLPPVATGTLSDPLQELEEDLAECRTFSDPSNQPDWSRARTACQRVLELEPIHPEANALLARINVLEQCAANVADARELFAAGRLETGLQRLEKVGKNCEVYLLRAMSLGLDPAREVQRKASSDCKSYASAGRWTLALPRCELASRIACQQWASNELAPPAMMKLKLEGPLNPRTEWRPRDEVALRFLQARAKVDPSAPPWSCPPLVALRAPSAAPHETGVLVNEELSKRYAEPELSRALVLYFQGDFHGAPVPAQRVLESMSKAAFHEAARALLLDINNAINLYANGTTELTNDRPERAVVAFNKALELDERLVLGDARLELDAASKKRELARRTSYLRRTINDSMGSRTYEKGKASADRKDFRAACRAWKLGLSFSRANLDLLKAATNVCTPRAYEAVRAAETCEQLRAGLDFAVDGDGAAEKLREKLLDQGCRETAPPP